MSILFTGKKGLATFKFSLVGEKKWRCNQISILNIKFSAAS